jgi:hypothetical protein
MMDATGPIDWTAQKATLAGKITNTFHSAWVDAELIKVGNAVLDGVAKLSQDKPDIIAALQALAKGDKNSAVSALETALIAVLPADVAALLSA